LRSYLLGLSNCHEAFLCAPVVRSLQAAGDTVRVAWFGDERGLSDARALGLPRTEDLLPEHLLPDASPTRSLSASAAFAEAVVAEPDVVLTIGRSPFALALGVVGQSRGPVVVRLDAGRRGDPTVHAATGALADRAALRFCTTNEPARQDLLRDGIPASSIAAIGSLAAAALRQLPERAPDEAYVWLAIESQLSRNWGIPNLIAACRVGAEAAGLALRAVPTVLRPALDAIGQDHGDLFYPDADQARAQLDHARSAAVVVTDDVGHAELAAAARVPCVLLPLGGDPTHLRLLGHTHHVGSLHDLPDVIAHALQTGAGTPLPDVDAGEKARAAIEAWLAPKATPRDADAPTHGNLPSDGDASGRTFGVEESELVERVLQSGTLNSTRGTYVHRFEKEFAAWQGSKHAIACANGSAAVHCAIAALGLSAGDEVITTPITDMGALTPIFYEGAVPVFADVDPDTLNVTAATIEEQLTERTKAIIVTHLFGRPCDMQPIVELACRHDLPIVEDTAQAFGATIDGRKAGRHGLISAFSLQQGKHITTGEGGIVCTDDDELARKVFLFVNKAWGYGDEQPDHYFPALNYRMTELQGAVACGQLPKLDDVIARRRDAARTIRERLSQLHGIACPDDPPNGAHSYWKFAFRVDADVVPGGAVALGKRMRDAGIACAPRYVQKPAFECQLFRDWREHPVSSLPLQHNPRGSAEGPLFERADYPGAIAGLEQVVVLPINERYHEGHAMLVADAIGGAWRELTRG